MKTKLALVLVSLFIDHIALATVIPIPNGDFSDPANNASVGGGLVGGTGSNVAIGSGPCTAPYSGETDLGSNTTEVTLQFTTGAVAPSGNIGIELFAQPNGVLNGNLLPSVSFDNVTLDGVPTVPESNATGYASFALCALAVAIHHVRRRKRQLANLS